MEIMLRFKGFAILRSIFCFKCLWRRFRNAEQCFDVYETHFPLHVTMRDKNREKKQAHVETRPSRWVALSWCEIQDRYRL